LATTLVVERIAVEREKERFCQHEPLPAEFL
jgi:hypothetical protein